MKVGLLESHAARSSAYWAALLKELGVEVAAPVLADGEALEIGRESLPGEALGVQLALGRILALGRVDAVLVPRLPAVNADAWGEAFTELLPRRISGLPTLIDVPDGGPELESAAAEVGLRLTQNGGTVRRALDRSRLLAGGPRADMPMLTRASRVTVAVIGPRALLAEPVLAGGLRPALEALGLHPVFSHDLPLADVLKRAERMENAEKAADGERELFGAASLLSGKSAVRGLLLAAPARDGAAGAALHRVAQRMHKPTLSMTVEAGQTEFPELEAFRDRVTLGQGQPAGEGA
ncbi:hypothetical protein HNQ07_003086 [Deinococcus metalli]|uniref:Uncharacterized protein n=1 Tax=Deinococcus metalli TaxID=1141878 RepID=A0A7W8NSX0_9DEIO|nr:hypothetical protein [Deinococcus metalli]MBB5377587.1 hypothetical protein [Deinococcus metalli]GHF51893.1 hypothetical protein GCM10017781_30140 [Deinococcus metalli]